MSRSEIFLITILSKLCKLDKVLTQTSRKNSAFIYHVTLKLSLLKQVLIVEMIPENGRKLMMSIYHSGLQSPSEFLEKIFENIPILRNEGKQC